MPYVGQITIVIAMLPYIGLSWLVGVIPNEMGRGKFQPRKANRPKYFPMRLGRRHPGTIGS